MPEHQTTRTIDQAEIRRRAAEARGGLAPMVRETGDSDASAGVSRVAFNNDAWLETVDREDVFKKFEDEELAFLFQQKTRNPKRCRLSKLVSRD